MPLMNFIFNGIKGWDLLSTVAEVLNHKSSVLWGMIRYFMLQEAAHHTYLLNNFFICYWLTEQMIFASDILQVE